MTSERDRLVELLAEHVHFRGIGECRRGSPIPFTDCGPDTHWDDHLADVLIANGWSRTVQRPEVDAEVEWGVRYEDGMVSKETSRERAERTIASLRRRGFVDLGEIVSRRTVGPWQEAQ